VTAPETEHECIKWDDVAKRLIGSKKPEKEIKVDVQGAARGQIESAMLLWFLEADPVSIHTLAVAAQELLHNANLEGSKKSPVKSLIKSWPKARQIKLKVAQNFFKHGPDRKNPGPTVDYRPIFGLAALLDATACYIASYGYKATPLMRIFAARQDLEDGRPAILNGINVDELKDFSRSDFLIQGITKSGRAILLKKLQAKQK